MAYRKPIPSTKTKKQLNTRRKRLTKKRFWIGSSIVVGVLSLIALFYLVVMPYSAALGISAQATAAQDEIASLKNVSVAKKKQADAKYQYGAENDGIPDKEQLSDFQAMTAPMTTWGYAAAPVQPGLEKPVNVLPINEGASNQTLAWGWGTIEPGYKMGQHNNLLAIHNFADGVTYGSPLQDIDVSKNPRFYQTDGKDVYTYALTSKRDDVKATGEDYTNAIAQTVEDKVTLVTCYLPFRIFTPDPEMRVVVSGDLVDKVPFDKAPKEVQALFPMF